ncbi:hypothetical protein GOBAR_DD18347 [Gossypium barbadense]|nr:hypothetical protein GOBAR_DD18347 [Gossypium barbadense]
MVNLVIEALIDNDLNIDEQTIVLIDEATRAFTEALDDASSHRSCPATGRNGVSLSCFSYFSLCAAIEYFHFASNNVADKVVAEEKAEELLKAIKADLGRVRAEEIYKEGRLIAVESSLLEFKRVIGDLTAKAKLVDDLVNLVIQVVIDNDLNIDEQTTVLIDEAIRAFTQALNGAQSHGSCPAAGENGGGHDSSFDHPD